MFHQIIIATAHLSAFYIGSCESVNKTLPPVRFHRVNTDNAMDLVYAAA